MDPDDALVAALIAAAVLMTALYAFASSRERVSSLERSHASSLERSRERDSALERQPTRARARVARPTTRQ